MSEKTCKTVRLTAGCVLSAMTVIVGALFIWQVTAAYFSGADAGDFIFSQSGLYERFTRISPAFWLWIFLIAAGFVVWEIFPVTSPKKVYKDPCYNLARLKKRFPETVGDGLKESYSFIKREEKLLKILRLCCAVLAAAGVIYSIVYLAIPSHFPNKDVTHEVLNAAKNILPWAGVTFVTACGITCYEALSAKKQLEHAKKLAAGNKPVSKEDGKVYAILHHKYFLPAVRIVIACVAVSFIIAGALNGNMSEILAKAAKICSECIGLG